MPRSATTPAAEIDFAISSRIARASRQIALGQREGDVGVTFGRDVLHDHVDVDARLGQGLNTVAAIPGWSGTPNSVIFASPVSCAIPETIACSIAAPSSLIQVPSSSRKDDRTCNAHASRACVLDRPEHQHARAAGGEIEHLLVRERRRACARPARAAGRRCRRRRRRCRSHNVGAERRGERDRGRVRPAAAERRHVVAVGDALEAGDDRDLAARDRRGDPVGAHADDPRVAVARVGEDAGLRAGQRDGRQAALEQRHRQQRDRDLLTRGEQHVGLAGGATRSSPAPRARAARRSSRPSPRRRRRPRPRRRPSRRRDRRRA